MNEFSRSNIFLGSFILGVLGGGDIPQKKIDCESSFEVLKMLGCLKCNYENCILFRESFTTLNKMFHIVLQSMPF